MQGPGSMGWGGHDPLGRAGMGAGESLGKRVANLLFPNAPLAVRLATPVLDVLGVGLCGMADLGAVANQINEVAGWAGADVTEEQLRDACVRVAAGPAPAPRAESDRDRYARIFRAWLDATVPGLPAQAATATTATMIGGYDLDSACAVGLTGQMAADINTLLAPFGRSVTVEQMAGMCDRLGMPAPPEPPRGWLPYRPAPAPPKTKGGSTGWLLAAAAGIAALVAAQS